MRTFVLHPTTAAVLAGIESFQVNHDPRVIVPLLANVQGVWIIKGAAPTDLEQRAIHDRLTALLPLVMDAVQAHADYLVATAPIAPSLIDPGTISVG